ncbi:hypothetical protein A0J48_020165 [Sphaerospermopsis aphanizomenoides BCCUSP55]|uniref:hypothetical protein n=1 Tax=Sphaerospermopsis aphanizomenoides TaxID=459663 RepID=UPI0019071CF6|nr:hypothetical protein [Sphaerospermopsis aphanizomenoides]MBK1989817.1 hypothetical protein [Sphaerospermopsis aphanizomenoides BCCUSP55]
MKTVVKLTHQSVIGEIESVLDTYPYQPYQQAFAIPDLRQELISFVINRLPCFSSEVLEQPISLEEDQKDNSLHHKLSRNPLEQQLHLQNLIHQGIVSIIQQKSDWISHHLSETIEPGCQTSHWFG